ncbi:MAG TPA: TlyA family RNA methyltransferase, partial [Nitrolancea sp.]|nr:TlyA family RNA methyltransferase [Nitrolancea sp.]
VERQLAENRSRARALIMAGQVRLGDRVIEKAGQQLSPEAELTVVEPARFVSRGGEKLDHALDAFQINVNGLVCADFGASTGGFTDVLLQRGATRIYAIDVGYGQLDYRLRQDARVNVLERTNIRYLESLPERVDLVVIDVSFISLRLILPAALRLLKPEGHVVALIKPQFEAGREQVGKGGVVRDRKVHRAVLERVLAEAEEIGFKPTGLTRSPITGPAGNIEFLALLEREPAQSADRERMIAVVLEERREDRE